MNAQTNSIHISQIKAGDTIIHNGQLTTVCKNNIKHDTFMGTSLFGDTYRSGTVPVKKVVAWVGANNSLIPVR